MNFLLDMCDWKCLQACVTTSTPPSDPELQVSTSSADTERVFSPRGTMDCCEYKLAVLTPRIRCTPRPPRTIISSGFSLLSAVLLKSREVLVEKGAEKSFLGEDVAGSFWM